MRLSSSLVILHTWVGETASTIEYAIMVNSTVVPVDADKTGCAHIGNRSIHKPLNAASPIELPLLPVSPQRKARNVFCHLKSFRIKAG